MLRRRLRGGWGNADGLAALEFALMAPMMLLIFMGSIEFPRAYGTSQRLLRSVRTMADLIARGGVPNTDDVFAAGAAVTFPTDLTRAGIVLTAVGVYPQGNATVAKVCSSVARNAAPRAVGSILGPPPDSEAVAGGRYVMVETSYTYVPIFNLFPSLNALTFTKQVTWPMRSTGTAAIETILPGGRSCPAT